MDKNLIYLESILLVSDKAVSVKMLAESLEIKLSDVKDLIKILEEKYNKEDSGIHLSISHDKIQFTSNPICESIVKNFTKQELNSNLSDASLETLTVIAYRGHITKSEIEQIRGVNCGLILRNLLIKGLIEKEYDKEKMSDIYFVTNDFLKYLGISSVDQLPDFEKLSSSEVLNDILGDQSKEDKNNNFENKQDE